MTVGGHDVHFDGEDRSPDTLEFIISMHVAYREPAGGVDGNVSLKVLNDGATGAISHGMGRPVVDVPGDGMQEANPLHKKEEINTQGDVRMMVKDRSRDGDRGERRRAWRSRGTGGTALVIRNVAAVDEVGATGIVDGDRAIMQEVVGKDLLKKRIPRPPKFSIQGSGIIGCSNLSTGEQLLLLRYCGNHRISGNSVVSIVRLKHIKTRRVFLKRHHGAIEAVDKHGRGGGRIHSDTTNLSDIGEGKDVGNRVVIYPHFAEIGKVADHV